MSELSENEKIEMEVENKLAYILASVYIRIPWRKIGVKSAHTFFVDRIRASSNTRDFKQFLDTLTMKVNVEFVKIDTKYIDFLCEHNNLTMMLLRKETIYIVNFALETVDIVKEERELSKNGQKKLMEA